MERFDFDALAKDLAHGVSRREILQQLGRGLIVSFVATLGLGRRTLAQTASETERIECLKKCDEKNAKCLSDMDRLYQTRLTQIAAALKACQDNCPTLPFDPACLPKCSADYARNLHAAQAAHTQDLVYCAGQDRACRGDCPDCRIPCVGGQTCKKMGPNWQCVCEGTAATFCPQVRMCVDTSASDAHCGGCGGKPRACIPPDEHCVNSHCVPNCPADRPDVCGGECVNKSTDRDHCGPNCVKCAFNEICQGTCTRCFGRNDKVCNNKCVDTTDRTQFCGTCENPPCAPSEQCDSGQCRCHGQPRCSSGETCCSDGCFNLQTSTTHCLSCEAPPCAPGQICSPQGCVCPDPAQGLCHGECADQCCGGITPCPRERECCTGGICCEFGLSCIKDTCRINVCTEPTGGVSTQSVRQAESCVPCSSTVPCPDPTTQDCCKDTGVCVTLGTDRNCTACGNVCPENEHCVSSTAGCDCNPGYARDQATGACKKSGVCNADTDCDTTKERCCPVDPNDPNGPKHCVPLDQNCCGCGRPCGETRHCAKGAGGNFQCVCKPGLVPPFCTTEPRPCAEGGYAVPLGETGICTATRGKYCNNQCCEGAYVGVVSIEVVGELASDFAFPDYVEQANKAFNQACADGVPSAGWAYQMRFTPSRLGLETVAMHTTWLTCVTRANCYSTFDGSDQYHNGVGVEPFCS
jgi:hypothetical protein